MEFTEYANRALLSSEKAGAVCSWCGGTLPDNYYLLLSAWRSETKEIVTPTMRFCSGCFDKIQRLVTSTGRKQRLL